MARADTFFCKYTLPVFTSLHLTNFLQYLVDLTCIYTSNYFLNFLCLRDSLSFFALLNLIQISLTRIPLNELILTTVILIQLHLSQFNDNPPNVTKLK